MSEEELQELLNQAQEKIRLNAIAHLKDLGYKGKTENLTIEQLEARIEVLKEQQKTEPKPKLEGIDGFKENIKALTGKDLEDPGELDPDEYDALQAHISQLAPDERLNKFVGARVLRLWLPIHLGDGKTTLRRVIP
ncbi:MAG: hypothetical protein ACFFDT_21205 [Candidatus Hodarchaeota archaeon]